MAFNFNWSPLTADAEFYTRAQDMLTAALNKSPKPPIIVDDIIVNELNLGSVPPELEILEIGDLAEDRFRGIFKMCYSGDAFLTLKTRVQANPLNTYLFSKPSFCSPQPLAASSGLTIPLQITLSEIKLSAFIILVFSKQKGLTLVFRNDPLESLKVSSTFDSIPFVREYLQKEIEGQLRNLFMEDLPAIIHRLSLRLWCPDSGAREDEAQVVKEHIQDELAEVDPFASPPQDAVDAHGNVLDAAEISNLSLDGSEMHSLFSQKNLLRLAALTDSQRTFSLFTPSIREAVFRAWASPTERGESSGSSGMTPSLSRTQSTLGSIANSGTTYTFSDNGAEDNKLPSRPSLTSLPSMTGLSLGSGRHLRTHRKKKNRVVNLRKNKTSGDESASESGESTTATESSFASSSEPAAVPTRIPEEPEEELITPPRSPNNRVRFRARQDSIDLGETVTPLARRSRAETLTPAKSAISQRTAMNMATAMDIPSPSIEIAEATPKAQQQAESTRPHRPAFTRSSGYPVQKGSSSDSMCSTIPLRFGSPAPSLEQGHGIVEQAWMMKMAGELARRAHEQKSQNAGFWASEREDTPPPAYEIQ